MTNHVETIVLALSKWLVDLRLHPESYVPGAYDEWGDSIEAALAWITALPQMPQPDWANAPDAAMWWCVDPRGECFWSTKEPYIVDYEWLSDGPNIMSNAGVVDLPLGIDWRVLKQARPQATVE